LCKEDILDLNFPFTPEFNQTVTVQPDGYITLRAVGDLHVEGQTVPEVTQSLRTAYGKILRDPVITIALKDFDKPYFIVSGEVARPGKFDLRSDTTVTCQAQMRLTWWCFAVSGKALGRAGFACAPAKPWRLE
jgi:polysaccharide export outer membrane protein